MDIESELNGKSLMSSNRKTAATTAWNFRSRKDLFKKFAAPLHMITFPEGMMLTFTSSLMVQSKKRASKQFIDPSAVEITRVSAKPKFLYQEFSY